MIAQKVEQTQVSPEPKLTIAAACADPKFQALLRQAHPRWWKDGFEKSVPPTDLAFAIIRQLCDGEPNEAHPEFKALVSALERTQVADL